MLKLRVKSKTTLQKLRDEGKIRFSQPEKKIILYDLQSIYSYLDHNAKDLRWQKATTIYLSKGLTKDISSQNTSRSFF